MSGLHWGRRYLMCPPLHYGVLYEINPWMHREVSVDHERAVAQWDELVRVVRSAGAEVELMDAVEGLPDLVFTANAGVVWGTRFVVSRFRHPERRGESRIDRDWSTARGFVVVDLDGDAHFEGAGDALVFGGRLLAGYRFRSDFPAHLELSKVTGVEVLSVELTDARFYHLDLTFCPLDERRAIVVPDAWDAYGREVVGRLVPSPVVLNLDEALTFCANSIVVGSRVIMPACPPRVGRELEASGFDVAVCPVDEFLKAGGGVRCLTLALDVGPQP